MDPKHKNNIQTESMNYVRSVTGKIINKAASLFVQYLRPLTPAVRNCFYNNYEVAQKIRYWDVVFPEKSRLRHPMAHDDQLYESSLCDAIEDSVKTGDHIVIVGGGYGVTALHAAHQAGPTGKVTVFEGSKERFHKLVRSIEINGLDCRIDPVKAIVGSASGVTGNTVENRVPSTELPECDVLELDCEGCELELLNSLSINPHTILVETHGFAGSSTDECKVSLENAGYRVVCLGLAEPHKKETCVENDIRVLLARNRRLENANRR
jgi:hypothetical protein